MRIPEVYQSKYVLPIHKLIGYQSGEPIWGKTIALYHPLTSSLIELDQVDMEVLNAINSGVSEKTRENRQIRKSFASLQKLSVLHPVGTSEPLPNFTPSPRTTVYVSLTEACNYGCEDCAVDVDQHRGKPARTMTKEETERTLIGAAKSTINRGQKEMQIKWAGGEPTLPKPWQLLIESQQTLAKIQRDNPRMHIGQMILTNGSKVTQEMAKILADLGIHVSVSLYGLGEENQQLRSAPNGTLTPEEALQNLFDARASFGVNHVVGPHNVTGLRKIINALWNRENPIPMSIAFTRGKTESHARSNAEELEPMVAGLRQGFDLIRELLSNGRQIPPLLRIDYFSPYNLTRAACGTGFNYFAAGPRGVTSCHEKVRYLNSSIPANADLLSLANAEHPNTDSLLGYYKEWKAITDPRIQATLMYHGGAGCPRLAAREGLDQSAPASTSIIYAKIAEEFISLEASRRLSLQ